MEASKLTFVLEHLAPLHDDVRRALLKNDDLETVRLLIDKTTLAQLRQDYANGELHCSLHRQWTVELHCMHAYAQLRRNGPRVNTVDELQAMLDVVGLSGPSELRGLLQANMAQALMSAELVEGLERAVGLLSNASTAFKQSDRRVERGIVRQMMGEAYLCMHIPTYALRALLYAQDDFRAAWRDGKMVPGLYRALLHAQLAIGNGLVPHRRFRSNRHARTALRFDTGDAWLHDTAIVDSLHELIRLKPSQRHSKFAKLRLAPLCMLIN